MRKWGILISVFYALILLAFVVPGAIFLAFDKFEGWVKFFRSVIEAYGDWLLWLHIVAVLASQALLLFLSVDTSQKRLKPRLAHSRFCHRRCASHRSSFFCGDLVLGFRDSRRGFLEVFLPKGSQSPAFLGRPLGALGSRLLSVLPKR
jgi:hypothetical protein